jgi:hypothetical protein
MRALANISLPSAGPRGHSAKHVKKIIFLPSAWGWHSTKYVLKKYKKIAECRARQNMFLKK